MPQEGTDVLQMSLIDGIEGGELATVNVEHAHGVAIVGEHGNDNL